MRDLGGVLYCNTGDWVESCTALVEQHDGRLELLSLLPRTAASAAPAAHVALT
jgi:UDP-2,3-diacylglucosamine pyrophosphatase LpxH